MGSFQNLNSGKQANFEQEQRMFTKLFLYVPFDILTRTINIITEKLYYYIKKEKNVVQNYLRKYSK